MPSILSTNMASLYAQRSLAAAQADVTTSVQKLSSGKRINSAKDDAAGLGISEGISGIRNISNQSIRNLQNASSLVQTADGALDAVGKILQRALTLSVQKNDAVLSASERSSIDTEISSLIDEIERIKSRTKFNGSVSIFGQTYSFGAGPGVTTTFTIPDLSTIALGLTGGSGTAPVGGVSLTRAALGNVTIPAAVVGTGSTSDRAALGNVTIPAAVVGTGSTSDRAVTGTLVGNLSKPGSVVTSNIFSIASHGFVSGDQVIYSQGSGGAIGSLVNNTRYIVRNAQAGSFQLSAVGSESIINFTGLGSSTDAKFFKLTSPTASISSIATENTTTTTLLINQSWSNGRKVFFAAGTATQTGGLQNGQVYTVSARTSNSVILLDGSGNPVSFGFGDDLNGSSLTYLGVTDNNFTVNNSQLTRADHGFLGGEKFFYSGNTANGLTRNTTYYVSTVLLAGGIVDVDNFRLATTQSDATNRVNLVSINDGAPIDLSGTSFYWASPTGSPITGFTSNPVLPANSFVLNATGLSQGNQVVYRQGNAAIGGLIDGSIYYVKTANSNVIQLSETVDGAAIPIGSFGSLTGATFQKVVAQPTFNSASPTVVVLNNTISSAEHGFTDNNIVYYRANSGTVIVGLTDGNPYFIKRIDADNFQLSETLDGDAISLRGLGNINQTFSLVSNTILATNTFTDGDDVLYTATDGASGAIAGLTNNTHYFIRNRTADSFQLSLTADGPIIEFTGQGTGDQNFTSNTNLINADNNFSTGDEVIYQQGGGSAIVGLIDGHHYIVRNRTANSFQLSSTTNETIIDISSVGALATTFTSVPKSNTILATNTFTDGDDVLYTATDGASGAIAGLTNNTHYFIRNRTADSFQLSLTADGPIIEFTGQGTGDQNFTSNTNLINADNNFSTGDEVIYQQGGGSAIVGLIDGHHYIVRNRTANSFQLSSTANETIIDISSVGALATTFTSVPKSNTILATNTFTDGDRVVYSVAAGDTVIPGLTNNTPYIIRNRTADSFQLSLTADGPIIEFTGQGTGDQNFTSNTNFIISDDHGLSNGDRVVYSVDAGDTVIPGLTNNTPYIIRNRTADSFQLSLTADGPIITLNGPGDGAFLFESVTISTALLTDAIATNSRNRAELGSRLNTLSYAIDSLETMSNNLSEAYSRIVDTDYAAETANLTRNQILQEAAAAMLAQANQAPNVILSLLDSQSSSTSA